MHAVVFAPSDIAPQGYLFVIQRGVVLHNGRVLTKGGSFGEDMILQDASLRLAATARAMNFVEANYVSRTELLMLARRYPQTLRRIRRAAILVSLHREIVRIARYARNHPNASAEKRVGVHKSLFLEWYGAIDLADRQARQQTSTHTVDDDEVLGAPASPGPRDGGSRRSARRSKAVVARKHARGGRLEGHAHDLSVQFELVNEELEFMKSELGSLRGDSERILLALGALGLAGGASQGAVEGVEPGRGTVMQPLEA